MPTIDLRDQALTRFIAATKAHLLIAKACGPTDSPVLQAVAFAAPDDALHMQTTDRYALLHSVHGNDAPSWVTPLPGPDHTAIAIADVEAVLRLASKRLLRCVTLDVTDDAVTITTAEGRSLTVPAEVGQHPDMRKVIPGDDRPATVEDAGFVLDPKRMERAAKIGCLLGDTAMRIKPGGTTGAVVMHAASDADDYWRMCLMTRRPGV